MKNKVIDLVKVKANLDRIENLLKENPSVAERTRDFLSGALPDIEMEGNGMVGMIHKAFWLPEKLFEAAEKMLPRLKKQMDKNQLSLPGRKAAIHTSDVIRLALQKGIESLDVELPAARSKVKRKKKK